MRAVAGLAAALLVPLAAAPLAAPQARSHDPWNALERELWIRRQALGGAGPTAELAAALEDARWTRRAAALEALRRALRTGPVDAARALAASLGGRLRALAADADAPERAQALAALAAWPDPVELADEALAGALEGPPPVALASALLLERSASPAAPARLERLAAHPDARVRSAARASLAAHPQGADGLARLLEGLDPRDERDDLLEGLQLLERCAPSEPALDALARELEARSGADQQARAAALAGVEAVRAVTHGRADVRRLVAGWTAPRDRGLAHRALLLRAARAVGPPLCEALLEAAARAEDPAAFLEGAVEAAAPARVVVLASGREAFRGLAGEELWRLLLGRASAWEEAVVAPWLQPALPADLREAVLDTLAATLGESGDGGSGRLLVGALDGAEERLAERAFRSLCAATDPQPWLEPLHAAWTALPEREQVARLRWLPRGRPLGAGFVQALGALGARDLGARAACAELIAGSVGEAGPSSLLEAWLAEELERVVALGGGDVVSEQRAIALVRALRDQAGARASESLASAASSCAHVSLPVAKAAVAALARTARGAPEWLTPWLDETWPSRLRVEAALALSREGGARAAEVLAQAYDGCDADLRARALRAVPAAGAEPALPLLRRVAFDRGEASELRRLAIDGLAVLGAREALLQLLAHERHPDARDAAITGLGGMGDDVACAALLELLAAVQRPPPRAAAEELSVERESLLVALAACGAWSPALERVWLARPLASARSDLETRFRGQRLAPPPFRFRGELALGGARAAQGELAVALEAAGPWWIVDGRLLGHLGVDAEAFEPPASVRLLRAAWIALLGEDDGEDGPQLRLELRRRLLAAAEARRDWPRVATLTQGLLADWRARRLPGRPEEELLGAYDPARGVDPRGRLESAVLQARAWAALEAGRASEARTLARRARARAGTSSEAARAQAALEAALEQR